MRRYHSSNFLFQDGAIIVLSLLITLIMTETNVLSGILAGVMSLKLLASFVAGVFFTSIFTTAPAIVALGEIANSNSIMLTAFFGALGAVLGDVVIFQFIRDRLSEHLIELVKHDKWWKKIHFLFRLKYFRWFTFLLGGIIIASPLPDELGIGLFGFSKMKMSLFIPISFIFNFLGITIIGILASTF